MSDPPDSTDDDVTAMVSTGATGTSGVEFDRALERLQQGDQLDRYIILSELGAGGMGVVYRAYDPKLRREVALKCLHSNALDRAAEARLAREAQAMAKLNHPNVVAVYDVNAGPQGLVLAMEYVSGGTLKGLQARERLWREIVARFSEAGRGLAAAHEQSIIHRDFKPANVLVSDDGRVKVTDFGLAKGVFGGTPSGPQSVDPPPGEIGSFDSDSLELPLTRADTVMGTPRYMAPEQHAGKEADARSDQYSFCVALWEALAGRPPFRTRGSQLGKEKIGGPPSWPKDLEVPRAIVRAIERGLAPAPSRRWGSMEELLDALAFDPARRRRELSVWVGVGALAVTALGGAYLWSSHRDALCASGEEAMAEVWNTSRVQSLAQTFGANDRSQVWEGLHQRLQGRAQAWVTKHREVCEATRLRGEQSQTVLELRVGCLEAQRRDWMAALDVLEGSSSTAIDHAVAVVETVGSPSLCDDTEALALRPAPSDVELDQQLRRFHAYAVGADHEAARALQTRLAPNPEVAESAELQARFELGAGHLAESTRATDRAQSHYEQAMALAVEHALPRIALQAALGLIRVVGSDPERSGEAQWLVTVARGLARQVDPGGTTDAAVLVEHARIAARQGDFESALTSLRSAEGMVIDAPLGSYSSERLAVEFATLRARQGDPVRARQHLKEARALYDSRWGSGHPQFAAALVRLGVALRDGGAPREAVEVLQEALRMFDTAGWARTVEAALGRLELGRARVASNDVDQDSFDAAAKQLAALLGETHPVTLDAALERARGLERGGEHGAAALQYVELLPDVEARFTKVHLRYVTVLMELASTREQQGEPEESIKLLHRARDIVGDVRAPAQLQLEISLSLAELQTDRNPSEALRFVEEARALAGPDTEPKLLERLAVLSR